MSEESKEWIDTIYPNIVPSGISLDELIKLGYRKDPYIDVKTIEGYPENSTSKTQLYDLEIGKSFMGYSVGTSQPPQKKYEIRLSNPLVILHDVRRTVSPAYHSEIKDLSYLQCPRLPYIFSNKDKSPGRVVETREWVFENTGSNNHYPNGLRFNQYIYGEYVERNGLVYREGLWQTVTTSIYEYDGSLANRSVFIDLYELGIPVVNKQYWNGSEKNIFSISRIIEYTASSGAPELCSAASFAATQLLGYATKLYDYYYSTPSQTIEYSLIPGRPSKYLETVTRSGSKITNIAINKNFDKDYVDISHFVIRHNDKKNKYDLFIHDVGLFEFNEEISTQKYIKELFNGNPATVLQQRM